MKLIFIEQAKHNIFRYRGSGGGMRGRGRGGLSGRGRGGGRGGRSDGGQDGAGGDGDGGVRNIGMIWHFHCSTITIQNYK